jgi:hypothetical protein
MMSIQENLAKIATADPTARQHAVLAILDTIGCPYTIVNGTNISIPYTTGTPRLIIGAHYDAYPGSTGANDNAAAVCILLELLRQHPSPSSPIEIIFFDQEERGMKGSYAYVENLDPGDVIGMVNLDMCGVGDQVMIGPRENTLQPPFVGKLPEATVLDLIPPSDDMMFQAAHIPTISVLVAPAEDCDGIEELARAMYHHTGPKTIPSIVHTMHNGSRDSLETVDMNAILLVYRWISTFITNWSHPHE